MKVKTLLKQFNSTVKVQIFLTFHGDIISMGTSQYLLDNKLGTNYNIVDCLIENNTLMIEVEGRL